jgi:hypothetical protein
MISHAIMLFIQTVLLVSVICFGLSTAGNWSDTRINQIKDWLVSKLGIK